MKQYLLSVIEPDGPVPPPEFLAKVMQDVEVFEREIKAAGAWVFNAALHPPITATLVRVKNGEALVTDGQHLVDDEDVGIDVHGDREGQSDVHAAGVKLHLGFDEVLDLTEVDHVVEDALHHFLGETKHRAVEKNVVATGEFGLKSGSEFEERGEAAPEVNLTRGGLQDSADAFQQGRLAGTVMTDQTDGFVRVHAEADVFERVERFDRSRARMEHSLLQ